ncbi:TNKS2 [Symbiodinium sp. CCMP2592]|nr:TNKS2 [Symbiodinium sp. CCMP2592]
MAVQALCQQFSVQKASDNEQIQCLSQQLSQQKAASENRIKHLFEQLSLQKAADKEQIERLSQQLSQQKAASENRIKHLFEQLSLQRVSDREQIEHLSQQLSQQMAANENQSKRHQEQITYLWQQIGELQQDHHAAQEVSKALLLSRLPEFVTAVSRSSPTVRRVVLPLHNFLSVLFLESMASHRQHLHSGRFCDPPKVEITRICESINPNIQEQYLHARKLLVQRRPDGCTPLRGITAFKCAVECGHVNLNEYLLFHGCPMGAVQSILENGLDPQRGGEAAGSMFGKGAYFAETASKSDLYTTCSECRSYRECKHPRAERCILVVRVLLGKTKIVTTEDCTSLNRAPEGYDTVTAQKTSNGGRLDHTEFVVYKEQMTLAQILGAWASSVLRVQEPPEHSALNAEGRVIAGMSAACGLMEVLFAFFICQLAAVEAYLIFTVWSLCEDMKVSMKGQLPQLLVHKQSREPVGDPASALFGGQNRGLGYGAF